MDFLKALTEAAGAGSVKTDVPMAEYTTFRIGGPADYLVTPADAAGLKAVTGVCKAWDVPFYIVGNGSNLLVGDDGFRGVIIHLCKTMDEMRFETKNDRLILTAGTGVMLSKAARTVSGMGYTGFEFATGIPGAMGGAVAMNAGAYGGEIRDVIVRARLMDQDGSIFDLDRDALDLGYRHSIIQDKSYILLEAEFAFEKGDAEAIAARVDELAVQRRTKQPLEYPSAGSTFKRPEGYFAGKLIQDCGLKGFKVGGAQVSEKHAGFVINAGHASARDVTDLIEHVTRCVREQFGVELEPEIRMIGSFR